ncbi:MAG TPA: glycosyltransferase [Candidatus Acidoferrales bacterium]|nr:glycosyltransferase [Candidatus Acidoferrales bacterium]
MNSTTRKIAFLGGTRYRQPLDATNRKKFRALRPLGELFVIGFSQSLRPRRFTDEAHFFLLPKLPVSLLRYVLMLAVGLPLALWLVFRHRVDVLVAQSPYEGFPAAWAKKISRWLGWKVALIVESHGDFEESVFLQRRVWLLGLYRLLMRSAARFAFKNADALRMISGSTKQQLDRWVSGKPMVQFPTWTDIDVFLQTVMGKEANLVQDIVYVGVLIPRKGIHHLINAFVQVAHDFPHARLVIVGDEANRFYAAELKEQAKAWGLNGRIQFVPEMSQAEFAISLRTACVFVLPSISEGLGRVVLEAMATGTPVIGSDVGGIPDMIQDGQTGFLVSPADEQALAQKLRWVLEHPEESQAMGRRARCFAEGFFSTDRYVDSYRQIFAAAHNLLVEQDKDHAPSAV